MSDLIAINAGVFNLAIQALKRAGKYEIAEQVETDCECVPDLIKQQRQRIAKLENAITQSLGDLEYAAFNLCEYSVLTGSSKGRVVESTCPETSLLIAIRDLKEAAQQPEEKDDE